MPHKQKFEPTEVLEAHMLAVLHGANQKPNERHLEILARRLVADGYIRVEKLIAEARENHDE